MSCVWMHAHANTLYEFSFYECMSMLMLIMTFFFYILHYMCIKMLTYAMYDFFFNIDYDVR